MDILGPHPLVLSVRIDKKKAISFLLKLVFDIFMSFHRTQPRHTIWVRTWDKYTYYRGHFYPTRPLITHQSGATLHLGYVGNSMTKSDLSTLTSLDTLIYINALTLWPPIIPNTRRWLHYLNEIRQNDIYESPSRGRSCHCDTHV